LIVVGVTGKYCAGKSTVAEILAEHGYIQVDVDRVGHEALVSERERVVTAFGQQICGKDGTIDRKALGRIVFAEAAKLQQLEAIIHPAMVERTAERVRQIRESNTSAPGVVINAAILFRMRLDTLCDLVIYVYAPFLSTWRRARERDGASIIEVVRRLRAQRDVEPQQFRSDTDVQKVENDGDREKLRAKLIRFVPMP
jgi:dephospho-CoA kinase